MNRLRLIALGMALGAAPSAVPADPPRETIQQLADDYFARRPSGSLHPGINPDEARRVQKEFVARLVPQLGRRVGFKVGLTSKAVQESVGAAAPVRGELLEKMLLEDGAQVSASFGARPIWEPDLIVTVKDDAINSAKTMLDVARNLSEIAAFIELPDRILTETVKVDGNLITAINASARLGVVGRAVKIDPTPDFVAALERMKVKATDESGAVLAEATGDALLGHPLNPVLWLINDLAATNERLKAGDRISLGSFARPQPPRPGQTITVSYDGLPGGPLKVKVKFAAGP